jgi:hypothetical protein
MVKPDVQETNPIIREVEATKNSLSTDRLDMSFGEIMNMYERNEIIIEPEYQRLFRWSEEQKTSFMESILLGIPIPPIFVAENEKGQWELIDGLQRISTVFSFFGILKSMPDKNYWKLEKGDFIKLIEGVDINSIPLKLKLNIKRSVCRVEIVDWNSEMDLRYELFNRLNTGGSPLTDQEIRNCIFRGISTEFNVFLSKMARNEDFIELIGPTQKQFEEKYLEELVLRFVALYKSGTNVPKSISSFLTDFMEKSIKTHSLNFSDFEVLFKRLIRILSPIGRDIFRGRNGIFSSSFYDGIMIGIAKYIDQYESNPSLILQKIEILKSSEEFRKYSGSASSSKERVMGRVNTAIQIFNPN